MLWFMKHAPLFVSLAIGIAGCANGGPTSTTGSTSTSEATLASTTALTSTTATTPTTVTTTTLGICTLHPIPAEAVQVQSRGGQDIDGDGTDDTVIGYAVAETWFLRVVLGNGSMIEDVVLDQSGISGVKPIGSHDLDDDGRSEVFAVIGEGAYTQIVGVWTANGCSLDRLLIDGTTPSTFLVGSSVGTINGISCNRSGDIEQTFASYLSDDQFEGGSHSYDKTGPATLSTGPGTSGFFDPSEAFELGVLDCPGVSLS